MTMRIAAFALGAMLGACASSGVPAPATLVLGQEACRSCRMAISTTRTAAQIVAANDEPLFFDDIGCLRDYLREHRITSPGAAVYVADHRTGAWTPARAATYVLKTEQDTPMGSHLFAYADPAAVQGESMNAVEVFRGIDLPGGGR
jgi:copper chaperone NosL